MIFWTCLKHEPVSQSCDGLTSHAWMVCDSGVRMAKCLKRLHFSITPFLVKGKASFSIKTLPLQQNLLSNKISPWTWQLGYICPDSPKKEALVIFFLMTSYTKKSIYITKRLEGRHNVCLVPGSWCLFSFAPSRGISVDLLLAQNSDSAGRDKKVSFLVTLM